MSTPKPDVVIVGGGPVGCVTAAAMAKRGAKVMVLEAHPQRKARFAGELLHPPPVRALRHIGLSAVDGVHEVQPCKGFAVFGQGQPQGVVLPYTRDHGVTFEHTALVEGLRAHVKAMPGITWVDNARARSLAGQRLTYQTQLGSQSVQAPLIVGADGKFSAIRSFLGQPRDKAALSYTAGLMLRGVTLPHEAHGHVFLGGLGPALAYRVEDDGVRICLDVPAAVRQCTNRLDRVWQGYEHALPQSLRQAIYTELQADRVLWAVNAVHARHYYGRPGAILVGDAVGHYHPMTAAGMSLGFADAMALAKADSFEAYRAKRSRESHVIGLLATALYEIFALDTEPTLACRSAVFDFWRRSGLLRKQTMNLLSCERTDVITLLSAGLPMVAGAVVQVGRRSTRDRAPLRGADSARRILGLLQWLAWESVPRSLQLPGLRKPQVSPFEQLRVRAHQQPTR